MIRLPRLIVPGRYWIACLGAIVIGQFLIHGSRDVRGQQQPEAKSTMLRHVVMFQFKDSSSEADVQRVVDAFRALPSKISEIAAFEYGVNNSPEGLDGGLTHCFLVTFKSEADRAAYLPHPDHQAFVEVLKPHLEKVTVIDYWAKQ